MKRKDFLIGLLGGCGTYATVHIFEQYANIFPATREWERPRIIIDNNCVMPSRVRAYLYNEKRDQLIDEMSSSFRLLINAGCSHILVGCNTAHLFLEDIFEHVPEAKERTVSIINECVEKVKADEYSEVFLLGTEGTIDSGVYQKAFEAVGIECKCPDETDYYRLRECIEAVKQNKYSEKAKEYFLDFMSRKGAVVLGCTELPILYKKYENDIGAGRVFDPMEISLKRLYNVFVDLPE